MAAIVFGACLFVVGTLLYFSKYKGYLLHYLILWISLVPLLFHWLVGFTEESQYYELIQWSKYLGVFLFLLTFYKNRTIHGYGTVYILLAIVLCYSAFLSLYRHTSPIETIKYVFGAFFELMVLLGLSTIRIHSASLLRLIRVLLWIEILFVFFELLTGRVLFWQTDGVVGVEAAGTFRGSNIMAEFVTVMLYALIYNESKQDSRITARNWVLFLFVSVIIFLSGVRMALLAHLLISCVLIAKIYRLGERFKRHTVPILFLGGLAAALVYYGFSHYLASSEVTYDTQVTSAVERQNVLASLFLQEGYLSEHTTMYYSIYVLSFFPQNPILGPGLLFKSSSGYGGVVNETVGNLTDCTLALHICEGGIVGALLFILIYFFVLRDICFKSWGARIVFYYLILITITDPGIFFIGNYLGLIALVLIEKRHELPKRRLKTLL